MKSIFPILSKVLCILFLLNVAYADDNTNPVRQSLSNSNKTIPSNMVLLNFDHVDITSVVKLISELSNKNFLLDPKVKGVVSIISNKPILKSDAYKVLEQALRVQGFSVVEDNDTIKVLMSNDARYYNTKEISSSSIDKVKGDQVITTVFCFKIYFCY